MPPAATKRVWCWRKGRRSKRGPLGDGWGFRADVLEADEAGLHAVDGTGEDFACVLLRGNEFRIARTRRCGTTVSSHSLRGQIYLAAIAEHVVHAGGGQHAALVLLGGDLGCKPVAEAVLDGVSNIVDVQEGSDLHEALSVVLRRSEGPLTPSQGDVPNLADFLIGEGSDSATAHYLHAAAWCERHRAPRPARRCSAPRKASHPQEMGCRVRRSLRCVDPLLLYRLRRPIRERNSQQPSSGRFDARSNIRSQQ